MVGNVWEWCHSLNKPYPYEATDGRESELGDDWRVVRGGSWGYYRGDARCAARNGYHPGGRLGVGRGFRVVVSRALAFETLLPAT
jgi:formylglycine-generating enzyme required for sulfatase activity